ncbi:RNA polymerase subunit sigma [Paenibacillus sp. FSL H8-0548]|uniref:RNA polymerase sigma factor n=1 Tax=Paenibacillus sp. FSL H8-0548 TaxID=1920422 RepID=UPI00096BF267|nr:RNA polymerase sigma factor [Paenibacillus sp. FSL H8-0548]OMF37480.1 RNA polymerase subunit sigma [Paenibacillus sp. FSL H8-0548]
MADLKKIYDQYFQDIYLFALSLSRNEQIAEEITQETFFKALKNIEQFKGNCKISVWLCQIAKNTYYSYMDKQKRLATDDRPDRASGFDIEKHFVDKAETLRIHKLLHGLDEPYKEVFTLRIFGELSFDHISQVFGKTESWARVTFHRARHKIKVLMMEE